jgi:hypothetical protein
VSNKGKKILSHGLSGTPEYNAWKNARVRCTSPKDAGYKQYGGRGILMYEGWLNDPLAFIRHVGKKPTSKHWLERKNNNKGYVPGNVRWATRSQNLSNRRKYKALENFSNQELLTECRKRGLLQANKQR